MLRVTSSPGPHVASGGALRVGRLRGLRYVLLGVGALAIATGLWFGLLRLGIALPGAALSVAEFHGALMICGFLGTLISLERAVAAGRPWGYAAPIVSAIGTAALIGGAPALSASLYMIAGAILAVTTAALLTRQAELFAVVLVVSAIAWGIGTLQWLIGYPTAEAAGWWLAFLILTITAERVELSRLVRPPPWSQVALCGFVALILIGAFRAELHGATTPFFSLGLIGCAGWLLIFDVARRMIRQRGQVRFSAACLLSGHVWLGAAGLLALLSPPGTAAFAYDAVVHAIAIGFVLSMIFGHAPIILPAITGARVRYHAFAYIPLALLHASAALRVGADTFEWMTIRPYSGLLTVAALVVYALTLATASLRGRSRAI